MAGVSRKAVQFQALVHAWSDLDVAATVEQDRNTPGARVTVRVRLTQYASTGVDGAKVLAGARFPNGAGHDLRLSELGDLICDTDSPLQSAFAEIYEFAMDRSRLMHRNNM